MKTSVLKECFAEFRHRAFVPKFLKGRSSPVAVSSGMQVVSGIVIDGKVVVEGLSLPEGTAVTVLARGDEAVVKLSPEEEVDLLAALDEADREEGVPAAEFFARLRRLG